MGVHYEVPAGKNLVISGPANVTVKGGEVPAIVEDAAELQASAPSISALDPDTAESGAADIDLVITGTGFTPSSVIVFGANDEPTTLSDDGTTVSTGVRPSLFAPAVVPVTVRNGPARSAPLDFTFVDPGGAAATAARRDKHGKSSEGKK
jgi:hypothetical protein